MIKTMKRSKKSRTILILCGFLLVVMLCSLLWVKNHVHKLPEITGPLSISIQRRITGENGFPTVENYDFNLPVEAIEIGQFSKLFKKLSLYTSDDKQVISSGLTQFSVMYMTGKDLEKTVVLSFDEITDYLHLTVVPIEDTENKDSSIWLKSRQLDEWREEFYSLLEQSTGFLE